MDTAPEKLLWCSYKTSFISALPTEDLTARQTKYCTVEEVHSAKYVLHEHNMHRMHEHGIKESPIT